MKNILVCGAGGFIGSHMVRRLTELGNYVVAVDKTFPKYSLSPAYAFHLGDLRDYKFCEKVFESLRYDEVYQFAADMGGAGYIFTGENDAAVMHNSAQINLNIAEMCRQFKVPKIFYSSSACIYPEYNQLDPENPNCEESSAYPAAPDSEYGWERLFSERLYLSYHRNYGIDVKIARYHNIFGPEGTYQGGREKSPAAMCRKVIEAKEGTEIEVWGDGKQTRSFLYIDECINASIDLMASSSNIPTNIGSEEMVSINTLANTAIYVSEKYLSIKNVESNALGVRGRNSDNTLLKSTIGWVPSQPLIYGIALTYKWIYDQMQSERV